MGAALRKRQAALDDEVKAIAWKAPLYHCVQLVRHACFGFEGWIDVYHVGCADGFRARAWRFAIHYMAKKLVD